MGFFSTNVLSSTLLGTRNLFKDPIQHEIKNDMYKTYKTWHTTWFIPLHLIYNPLQSMTWHKIHIFCCFVEYSVFVPSDHYLGVGLLPFGECNVKILLWASCFHNSCSLFNCKHSLNNLITGTKARSLSDFLKFNNSFNPIWNIERMTTWIIL